MAGKLVHLSKEEKLKLHLKRTDNEKFHLFMQLYKLGMQMKKAKITYPKKK